MFAFRSLFACATLTTALLGFTTQAIATDLSLSAVADDTFTAYHSLNPAQIGTPFLSQSGTWTGGAQSGSITLTDGIVNYINIIARDQFGAPSMLLASLTLSDNQFFFNNGTQAAVSSSGIDWLAFNGSLANSPTTITDLGPNGTFPWGTISGIPVSARYIWTPGSLNDARIFQIAVTPVPEPATILALAAGAAFLKRRANRKTRN